MRERGRGRERERVKIYQLINKLCKNMKNGEQN